mmetsp:Transcript_4053/g.3447  ORF Transcript_4053/g.3447 Transcript_4053/m.3447 type:complete len:111 (-) Transcript_4053:281-613(-)
MAPRVTYRRTCAYNTRNNQVRHVRTPGGNLVAQHTIKKAKPIKCAVCPRPLAGIKTLRPTHYKSIRARTRSISRPYGGNLCGVCLKDRIMRAFLIEEVKIVKRVMNTKKN